MYEMKYDINDRPWVLGYRKETLERIPVQVRVDQRFLEQHYRNGPWIERYVVQQIEGDDLCVGFGTDPYETTEDGEPVTYPLFFVNLHVWDLFPSREAVEEFRDFQDDIF